MPGVCAAGGGGVQSPIAAAAARLRTRWRVVFALLSAGLASLGATGCYMGHLVVGQARVLCARQPIHAVIEDPETPKDLRDQLEVVQRVRGFARELGLEVGGQYTSYVPWPGDRVVTIVVATRSAEVEPAGYTFPFVGTVPYKGFFATEEAEDEARRQRNRGLDVCVVGVPAYSTLGWLDDPVTGPMVRREEQKLVEMILHELVHATVYVSSEPRFNEGIASFIGGEASVLFYAERGESGRAEERRRQIVDERKISATLAKLRSEIGDLYASTEPGADRDAARKAYEAAARQTLGALPLETRDPQQVARGTRLNDACLALSGTYSDDLEPYSSLLAQSAGNLRAFIRDVREAARKDDPRAALLSIVDAHAGREVRRTGKLPFEPSNARGPAEWKRRSP